MKTFRFTLDPILALRRQKEDECRRALAAAAAAVLDQNRRLAGWLEEEAATRNVLTDLKRGGFRSPVSGPPSSGAGAPSTVATPSARAADAGDGKRETRHAGRLDLVDIRLHEAYLNTLARRIGAGFAELQRLRAVEEEKRQALIRAMQERRVLERLRERRRKTWRYEADREEQKFLDEVSQQTFARAVARAHQDVRHRADESP